MLFLRKSQTTKKSLGCGAPEFESPKEVLENHFEESFTIQQIVPKLSVSEKTIYRRKQCYRLSSLNFSDISDDELDHHTTEFSKYFPFCGEGMIKCLLKERGIKVQRIRLRDFSIHRVDQEGVQERKKGRLQRRVYNVGGPNHLWYVDTHNNRRQS